MLAVPLVAGATSPPDPCHLLTMAQATAILGAKPWNGHHPLTNGLCSYSTPPGSHSGSTLPSIVITVKTGPKAVRGFGLSSNPRTPRRAAGSLPPGITAKDFQPHPLRLHGDPAYYVGPFPGTFSVTFHALAHGVVVVTGTNDVPGTPVGVGKTVMTDVLDNLK